MSRDTQSPGSILVHKFMNMDMNASKLARLAGLSIDTVHRIMCGVQPVTDEIASKLAVVLGTTQEFWTNIQTAWDIHRHNDMCQWCQHMSKIVRQANDQVALHANVSMHFKARTLELEAENADLRAEIDSIKQSKNS